MFFLLGCSSKWILVDLPIFFLKMGGEGGMWLIYFLKLELEK